MSIFVGHRLPVFQSTLPRGSDRKSRSWRYSLYDFNPRSLAGATEWRFFYVRKQKFQSTLPRGSDFLHHGCRISAYISIHAPSRERRATACGRFFARKISIHAPSRERRTLTLLYINSNCYFNPRSLAGATLTSLSIPFVVLNFNPRSLAGAT